MTRLNRKVEYALMALKALSRKQPGQLTSAKEVSDTLGSPFDATARVMQLMAQKGYLHAEQGVQGGYQIIKDLSKITYFDLLETILGPVYVVKCQEAKSACELFAHCNITQPAQRLQNRMNQLYRSIPLSELVYDSSKGAQGT